MEKTITGKNDDWRRQMRDRTAGANCQKRADMAGGASPNCRLSDVAWASCPCLESSSNHGRDARATFGNIREPPTIRRCAKTPENLRSVLWWVDCRRLRAAKK